ncbi:MAG: hypothetical protein BroJett040_15700 [Oligoflexia bacterium]|nr:MAG: hypothetical protein BroJett040_15700 [Oligoflexia bacterium]
MKFLISILILSFSVLLMTSKTQADSLQALKALPIQEAGRVKPFDTFARETLQLVHGKQTYEKRPATEILMTWVLQPTAWEEKKFIEIKHHLVKRALKFSETEKYFSPKEILTSDRLSMLMQELQAKREAKEKLDPYFQAVQLLEDQISTFQGVATGQLIKILPPKEGQNWIAITDFTEPQAQAFLEITKAYMGVLQFVMTGQGTGQLTESEVKSNLDQACEKFQALAKANQPELYPTTTKMNSEVHYNSFHPFKWAWVFYLLTLVSILLLWILKKDFLYKLSWLFISLGFLIHLYGFGLRMYLSERAPVSNMYETVVYVSLGTVLFAMVIEYLYRWRFIISAGAAVGAFCLILADLAPAVLDPSIHPLEPVLRSNFWLTVHVLTITISYAAFFLAFALGDIGLFYFLKGEHKHEAKIKAITLAVYRSIQIGTAFLAPGIILGGVWADYSWGRFWGWDPKETWALIALLAYMAVLHARMAGMLKNFGMIAAGVVSFATVIMAWYGVNYVLGAGLHSYGFGAGGVEYVAAFVGAHLVFTVFVAVARREKLNEKTT